MNLIPAALHRRLYRLAHAARTRLWRIRRTTLHGVRVVALDEDGRILLVRHSYGSDQWMPPGGGLASGEDPVQAAIRELREETGCVLRQPRLLALEEESLHASRNTVRIVRGLALESPRADNREIIDARFFPLDALPGAMPAGLAARVRTWATIAC